MPAKRNPFLWSSDDIEMTSLAGDLEEDEEDLDEVEASFCATGEGGGVDPHCSPGSGAATLPSQMDQWKMDLSSAKIHRDHAVAMIKQIKATGTTKGLSQWKKVRSDSNKKIDDLKKKISQANWSKPYEPPVAKTETVAPGVTATANTVALAGTQPYYVPGVTAQIPIYAKSLQDAQIKYPGAKPWDSIKAANGAVTPASPPPSVTVSTPVAPGMSWVTDSGEAVSGSGVRGLSPETGKAEYKSWVNNLTSDEKSSIKSYTGSSYASINAGFRKGVFSADKLATIHAIDSGLAKSPSLKEDTLLYRKIGSNADQLSKLVTGDVYVERGYVSTSVSKGVWSGSYVMNIKAPAGTGGGYVQQISSHKSEHEFILPRDTMFKVLRVRDGITQDGMYKGRVMDVEVVHAKK